MFEYLIVFTTFLIADRFSSDKFNIMYNLTKENLYTSFLSFLRSYEECRLDS